MEIFSTIALKIIDRPVNYLLQIIHYDKFVANPCKSTFKYENGYNDQVPRHKERIVIENKLQR